MAKNNVPSHPPHPRTHPPTYSPTHLLPSRSLPPISRPSHPRTHPPTHVLTYSHLALSLPSHSRPTPSHSHPPTHPPNPVTPHPAPATTLTFTSRTCDISHFGHQPARPPGRPPLSKEWKPPFDDFRVLGRSVRPTEIYYTGQYKTLLSTINVIGQGEGGGGGHALPRSRRQCRRKQSSHNSGTH